MKREKVGIRDQIIIITVIFIIFLLKLFIVLEFRFC